MAVLQLGPATAVIDNLRDRWPKRWRPRTRKAPA